MAVDTAPRRLSAMSFGRPSAPLPDGSIVLADRTQLVRLYSGIAAGAAATAPRSATVTARATWQATVAAD